MVLKIALDLDQQRPARQQRSERMAVDILDVHLFEPTGLHDAGDPDSIVAVVLVDLHFEHRFGMARVDARPSRLSSVHSQVDVGPVSRPMRTASGASDLT